MKLYDIVKLPQKAYYNDKSFDLVRGIKVNQQSVSADVVLTNNDRVVYEETGTIREFSMLLGEKVEAYAWTVNGKTVSSEYKLKNGDIIHKEYVGIPVVRSFNEETDTTLADMAEALNDETFTVSREVVAVEEVVEELTCDYEFTVNGKYVSVKNAKQNMVFVDIFDYIDFDLTVAKGIINLTLNGKRASYTETLTNGDNIEIAWR